MICHQPYTNQDIYKRAVPQKKKKNGDFEFSKGDVYADAVHVKLSVGTVIEVVDDRSIIIIIIII